MTTSAHDDSAASTNFQGGVPFGSEAASWVRKVGMSFDRLTGLPDRALFRDRLTQATAGAVRDGRTTSVMCLGCNDLADLRQRHGPELGDQIVRLIAERIKSSVRDADSVARLDDDEFGIIQVGLRQPRACQTLAQRLLEVLGEPMTIEGKTLRASFSIGLALVETTAENPETWLYQARLARDKARAEGPGIWRCADPELDAQLLARQRLEEELAVALQRDQLEVHYQPIVQLASRRIVAFEALLRWRHPERGLLTPGQFLEVAEESGLIVDLGAWALCQACIDAVIWPDALGVAVNLSVTQFNRGDLVAVVEGALATSGLEPGRLQLEITEELLTRGKDRALGMLRELRKLGVRISMDDFGTGYSSLSHLQSFPFDRVKIDHTLMSKIGTDTVAATIARAVISLGRSLGMRVTAEGVENEDQIKLLRNEGCDEVQGFYFSRALPNDDLRRLVELVGAQAVVLGCPESARHDRGILGLASA